MTRKFGRGLPVPEVRFAPVRGARLAYQTWGSGEDNVVAIPPFAQNIEMAWELSELRTMFDRFGTFSRFLHFDKRGTGCSDRTSGVNGLDERVEDLRAVMDHAGIEQAFLFGQSEGGPMTLLFAATYPDRVRGLILLGTGASLHPPDLTKEYVDDYLVRGREASRRWGTTESTIARHFAPSLAWDAEYLSWHQRYERAAAGTESFMGLIELGLSMDVRDVLEDLDVPTLVIHRTDDAGVSVAFGRELAAKIPGAVLLEEEGRDHYAYAGHTDSWLDAFEEFVTGTVAPQSTLSINPQVSIMTLGRFEVSVEGEPVPQAAWGSKQARQLCKRLVSARGWPITRDELFEQFWPGEADRNKLGARLSVLLSHVRRVLHGGVIADRDTIRLNHDEVSVDIEQLMSAPTDEAVLGLFAWEFLPEDRYEDWTVSTRDETRTKFVLAARREADRLEELGQLEEAAALAFRLRAIDGYDERAHARLFRLLTELGEAGEADRARLVWTQAMDELGLDGPTDP